MNNKKKKILENINYAKENNINKISAILISTNEEKKEIVSWLVLEGYKVSLVEDDVTILIVEW